MASEAGEQAVRVAEMFGAVARCLAELGDLQATLAKITDLAVEHLDGCEFAGVSLIEGGTITTTVSSDELAEAVDSIQTELGEGPCLDAMVEHEVFLVGDLAGEERWPRFAARAGQETGIRSILAVRLFVEEGTMGALNLYSTKSDAFDEIDVALATVFATHAAVALLAARREENLERKAESRAVIGRAIGILMARSNLDREQAFDVLRRASQRLNVKLVKLAERVEQSTTEDPPAGERPPLV